MKREIEEDDELLTCYEGKSPESSGVAGIQVGDDESKLVTGIERIHRKSWWSESKLLAGRRGRKGANDYND